MKKNNIILSVALASVIVVNSYNFIVIDKEIKQKETKITQLQNSKKKADTYISNSKSKIRQANEILQKDKDLEKKNKELEQINSNLASENDLLTKYYTAKGTGTPSRGGSITEGKLKIQKVKLEISMYSREEFNNNTESGIRPRYGIAAAPPEIPFGTDIYIPGINIPGFSNSETKEVYVVEDRGSYIQKVGDVYRIDIFVETTSMANKFGRQTVDGYFIFK